MNADDSAAPQPYLVQRVQRGDFDAALRPATIEEALLEGPERFFTLAAEIARSQFNPAAQWEEFVHALWEQADAGFGLSTADAQDDTVDHAWFDDPEDPPVVAWDRRPDGG